MRGTIITPYKHLVCFFGTVLTSRCLTCSNGLVMFPRISSNKYITGVMTEIRPFCQEQCFCMRLTSCMVEMDLPLCDWPLQLSSKGRSLWPCRQEKVTSSSTIFALHKPLLRLAKRNQPKNHWIVEELQKPKRSRGHEKTRKGKRFSQWGRSRRSPRPRPESSTDTLSLPWSVPHRDRECHGGGRGPP